MSLQYSSTFNPDQQRKFWSEHVSREQLARNRAHSQWNMPFGSWLSPKEFNKSATYFDNNKVYPRSSEYDRATNSTYSYNQKLSRDDRASRVDLNVLQEERSKSIPILSSSVYGFRTALEAPTREHVRVQCVKKGFYRSRGTNIPVKNDFNSITAAK